MSDTEVRKKTKQGVKIKAERQTSGISRASDTGRFPGKKSSGPSKEALMKPGQIPVRAWESFIRKECSIGDIPSPFFSNREAQRDLVKEGVPIVIFKVIKHWLDLSEKALADNLDIALRTLMRRKESDKFNKSESENILRLLGLIRMAYDLFNDSEIVKDWFKSPNVALGGKTPLEYADTEPGAREVEDLLGRLAHGVFS